LEVKDEGDMSGIYCGMTHEQVLPRFSLSFGR
jgi:hypothetical protein